MNRVSINDFVELMTSDSGPPCLLWLPIFQRLAAVENSKWFWPVHIISKITCLLAATSTSQFCLTSQLFLCYLVLVRVSPKWTLWIVRGVINLAVSWRYFTPGPQFTFPAREHHCRLSGTKLYCLVTEACVWTTCPESLPDDGMTGSQTLDLSIVSLMP